MLELLQTLTILASTLFAGAAIFINLVEHPARLACSTEVAATQFPESYRRTVPMQVSLALIATLSGIAVWLIIDDWMWLLAALAIFSVIPFTLLIIRATNDQLLATDVDKSAAGTRELLVRWGRLHGVRSGLSWVASVIFIVATVTQA